MAITKQLYQAGVYKDFFAQGVRVGDTLYLAGQVGADAEGNTPEDLEQQVINAYQSIMSILKEFGATMDNVVDETWFVTDVPAVMANVGPVFAARHKIYGGVPEVAQTLVGVTALVSHKYKVEIKCIAHL